MRLFFVLMTFYVLTQRAQAQDPAPASIEGGSTTATAGLAPGGQNLRQPGRPGKLAALETYETRRASSEDRPGNADWIVIGAGETTTIAHLDGPGEITHLWTTIDMPDEPHHLNKIVIRIYWDNNEFPSVEAPIGDFYGLGHGKYYYFSNPVQGIGTNRGMNAFWPMPFAESARVEIINESDKPVPKFYYYVDWRQFDSMQPGFGFFHAQYRQEFPCVSGRNYLFCETGGGPGHFAGVSLSIHTQVNGWWGEGDDIFTIDGEQRPSIWGTGAEDYFCGAWGYGEEFYTDYFGMPLRTRMDQGADNYWNVYRHHLESPVNFEESLKVEIEHGHDGVSNERGGKNNNYSSVAYYYLLQPQPLGGPLPPAAQRVPHYATPTGGPGVIEAHEMIHGEPKEGTLKRQELQADVYNEGWLNEDHLFRDAPPPGDVTELTFGTSETLRGEAALLMTMAPDYGQVRIRLNGNELESSLDGYSEKIVPLVLPLGEQELPPGKHVLEIEVVGKNSESSGYRWGIDYLRIGGEPLAMESAATTTTAGREKAQQDAEQKRVSLTTPAGLEGWHATAGAWAPADEAITGRGYLDNRLVMAEASHPELRWPVTIELQKGWSAGVLVFATSDGQRGYVARLDSRRGKLVLERTGPWPEVEELDSFPWNPLDGNKMELQIIAAQNTVQVFAPAKSNYPLLEARSVEPAGYHTGFLVLDAEAAFTAGRPGAAKISRIKTHTPEVGEYQHVYDPSVGESSPWYINDHCFIKGIDAWHLFGITHAQPGAPLDEIHFAHATSVEFPGSLETWEKQPHALTAKPEAGERHLWAPHIIERDGTYYMFYCAGSFNGGSDYRIHLATSKDLKTWTRYHDNPLFQDTFDARDPMILKDNGNYYMYYTANLDRNRSNHVVHLRTSTDLVNWSPASVAFVHPAEGTIAGPTESPYVAKYGSHFYLFIGPAGEYHRTTVYVSPNPLHWNYKAEITSIPSHAAEVVQDENGNWFASDCGWDKTGVYLAPLTWKINRH